MRWRDRVAPESVGWCRLCQSVPVGGLSLCDRCLDGRGRSAAASIRTTADAGVMCQAKAELKVVLDEIDRSGGDKPAAWVELLGRKLNERGCGPPPGAAIRVVSMRVPGAKLP